MASKTENRHLYIYVNDKMIQNNMRSIRKAYYKTNAELEKMDRSAKGYNQKVKDLQKLGGIMTEHRNKVRGVSQAYNRMKELAFAVLGGNLLTAGVARIQQAFSSLIRGVYDLADAQSDVRKTTNLSEQDYKRLEEKIRDYSKTTRTARLELLKLAEEAGRGGFKNVDDIMQFVKVMDQASVALGDDLGNDAIRSLGKLTNTFKVAKREGLDLESSLLSVGSAINELSASGPVQANYLVDFTSRLSGTAVQAKITETNIMGLGAVLDEAGQKVEMSGTALTQTILDMFKNTEYYAQIAGVSVSEYTKILNTDANEALLLFLEGLSGNNEGLQQMSQKLDDLGVDGVRAVSVLATLAEQTDKVREKQTLANTAFKEATSLTNEYNLRNNNIAGVMDKIQKKIYAAFLNPSIVSGIQTLVKWLGKLTGALEPQSVLLKKEIIDLNVARIKINDVNTEQEDRIKLITELQKKYPKYLGNLNAEEVSITELNNAFKDLNEQMVNRLIIQRKQDKIDEQNQRIADEKESVLQKEVTLQKTLGEMMIKYKSFELDANKSSLENAQELNSLLAKEAKKDMTTGIFNQKANDARSLRQVIVDLVIAQEDLNREENIANGLLEEKNELIKRLGMDKNETSKTKTEVEITPKLVEDTGTETEIQIQKFLVEKLDMSDNTEFKKAVKQYIETGFSDALEESVINNAEKLQERLAAFYQIQYATANPWEQMKMDAESYYAELFALAEKHQIDTTELERQKSEAIKAIDRDMNLARAERYYQAAQMTMQIADNLAEFANNKNQEELNNFKATQDRKLAIVENRLENNLITERQAELEKERIAEQTAKKEREIQLKAFRMQKAQRMAQAFMDAAAMQMRIWADVPKVDFGISTGILSGIAAGISTTQIAAITAQKPPKFKFGGTITDGPSHQMGGMPLFDPRTGRVVAELEGGEPVLSKKFAENNPEFTAAALQASKTGARLNIPFLGAQPQPSRKFATGGYIPNKSVGSAQTGNPMVVDNSEVVMELKAMRREFSNLKNIRAQLSMSELLDAEDEFNQIKSLGDMS